MIVTAAVYRQDAPRQVAHDEYRANLAHVADVTGTPSECWEQARQVVSNPVLEFPRAIYRRILDAQ